MTSSKCKCKCCETHYPRCPYTFTHQAFDDCFKGCNEPGIGSSNFSGGSCGSCSLVCLPIHILRDVICCIPLVFGYINLQKE